MAGGGIKKGLVHGSSNDTASEPQDDPMSVEDWGATLYHLLGIDHTKHLIAPGNRPVKIIDNGHIIDSLIA
jgi:hypothetical protein